jgi:WD40 repeat protein
MKNNTSTIAMYVLCMAVSGVLLFSQASPQASVQTVIRIDRENAHLGGGVALSPDGRLLAFVGNDNQLYLHNIDTAQEKALLEEAEPGIDVFSNPEFSSDGKSILFAASGGTRYYPSNIFSIHLDGSGLQPLTKAKQLPEGDDAPLYAEYFQSAKQSPDGTKVLLAIYDSVAEKEKVGMLDTNNMQVSYLAEGRPISWSHDGQEIYYSQNGVTKRLNLKTRESQVLNNLNGRIIGSNGDEFVIDQNGISTFATLEDNSVTVRPWNVPSAVSISHLQKNTGKPLVEQLALTSVRWSSTARLVLDYQNNTMERIEVIESTVR